MTDRPVELRSDTFTRPDAGMRRAMAEAEVGDDVWNEDPTVHRLEAQAADLMGKEAAVFVPSGTQGNLIGILAHTRLGNEVLVGDRSHLFRMEAAGTAAVGGLQLRTLSNRDDGRLRPEEVKAAFRSDDEHEPPTGLVVLENTHNACGGAVIPPDEVREVVDVAHAGGVPLHIDGARIFNAAVACGVPVVDLVAGADSITFCLSKALGAPVGSVLCGDQAYITRARRWRKMLGGGMRQAGILAAAGIYALTHNVARLEEDHRNARRLARGLAEIPGIRVSPAAIDSNMVFFGVEDPGINPGELRERLAVEGVRIGGSDGGRFRAVTSYEVTERDIDRALDAIARLLRPSVPVPA